MPITNAFATWSLGDSPDETKVSGLEGVSSEHKAPSTFVKQRGHTGVYSSMFPQESSTCKLQDDASSLERPPTKVQKLAHVNNSIIETVQKGVPIVVASTKHQAKHQQPPVPEQISFISNFDTNGSHGQEFGTLSDDDDLSESTKSDDDMKPRELLPAPFFGYRDHSSEVDQDPLLPLTPFSKIPNFPAKLMAILSRPDLADIVCWMPHGRSWRVLKPREFEIRVLPSYFEHQKLSSFIRQANGWGFHRISQGFDRNSYYHELFLQGLPHLCKKMKRPRVNKKPVVDPDNEPDFYAISEMYPLPSLHKEKVTLHDDILLPSTVIGGPKARMKLHVDKDELHQAVSRAISGSMALPPPPKSSFGYPDANAGLKKPTAATMATGLPTASSIFHLGGSAEASDVALAINSHIPSSWVPASLALPPSVHSLLSPPFNHSAATLSLMNPAMYNSSMGSATTSRNTSTISANPTVDPMSHLLLLLKQNQQQHQAISSWDSSLGDSNSFVNPSQTSSLLRLLNSSVPQASPDAAFAAGFAAATALHQKSMNVVTHSLPLDPKRSLELDAATAMFGLLENNCKQRTS